MGGNRVMPFASSNALMFDSIVKDKSHICWSTENITKVEKIQLVFTKCFYTPKGVYTLVL